jgi:hypothetical protein
MLQKEILLLIFLCNNHLLKLQRGTCCFAAGGLPKNSGGAAEKQQGICCKTADPLLKLADF